MATFTSPAALPTQRKRSSVINIKGSSSRGGSGTTSSALLNTGSGVSAETIAYHASMLPVWVGQLNPDDTTDYTHIPTGYLRDLYPYVYYWGTKADVLAENLGRMNVLRAQDLTEIKNRPGYGQHLEPGSFTEDLLLTYRGMKLTQMIVREDVTDLLPYLLALQQADLLRIAYRNVSTVDRHEENAIFFAADNTVLHTFYDRALMPYIPHAWEEKNDYRLSEQVPTIQSVFVRICLSAPVMGQVPGLVGDWDTHVAFCDRWGLTP